MALPNFTRIDWAQWARSHIYPTTEMKAAFGSSDVRSAALEKE